MPTPLRGSATRRFRRATLYADLQRRRPFLQRRRQPAMRAELREAQRFEALAIERRRPILELVLVADRAGLRARTFRGTPRRRTAPPGPAGRGRVRASAGNAARRCTPTGRPARTGAAIRNRRNAPGAGCACDRSARSRTRCRRTRDSARSGRSLRNGARHAPSPAPMSSTVRIGRSRWYSAVATASATLRASRARSPMPPRRYQRSK